MFYSTFMLHCGVRYFALDVSLSRFYPFVGLRSVSVVHKYTSWVCSQWSRQCSVSPSSKSHRVHRYCSFWVETLRDFVLYKRCLVGFRSVSAVYKPLLISIPKQRGALRYMRTYTLCIMCTTTTKPYPANHVSVSLSNSFISRSFLLVSLIFHPFQIISKIYFLGSFN